MEQTVSQQLMALADQASAIRAALRDLPAPNPNRDVGRATSLALTKTEEMIFWLGQAINYQLGMEANQ